MTDAEYRREKRGIAVPFFFKRKIFMVFVMLICSGIMAVTATYAWFILSTAPEVVGVTTTVGANGSLEIALLNNETGVDPGKITANVGDSIDIVGAVKGNVTWGNLVDVSDASYGLNTIVMYPAVLNSTNGTTMDTTAMLCIPRNGVDGRITSVTSNTMAALYNGTAFATGNAHYGVRAIGSVGGGSSREASLSAAKSSFTASQTSALAAAQNAVSANGRKLLTVVAGGEGGTYSYDDVAGLHSMATGLNNALNYILTSYKQAIIANAAAKSTVSDSDFNTIRTGVTAASASELANYASSYPSGISAQNLNALGQSISDAEFAINLANYLLYTDYGTEDQQPVAATTTYTYSQVSGIINKIANIDTINSGAITENTLTLSASVGGGLITAVADHAGDYSAASGEFTIKATTTNQNGAGTLSGIDLSELKAPTQSNAGTENQNTTVTDFYGYVVDLAFRTNVAANLQMQSEAIDRIYTDGAGATKGGGTGVIYTAPAGMTNTQVNSMLAAVRVVFFDPDTGSIYATGKLGTPSIQPAAAGSTTTTAAASLELISDGVTITALEAAVPKKVSVLVYLDGTMLNNISVFNAQTSGTLLFNFQFSSSADLKPMVDSELKNATSAESYGG